MNWKLRFKNKTTLTAIIFAVIALIYKVMDMAGIVPSIGQDDIKEAAEMAILLLCVLGIVVDPTTAGVSDSQRAMTYTEPYKEDEADDECE